MRTLFLVLCIMAAAPAAAQLRPQPGSGDPRLQTVDYDPGQVVQLHGAPGYQLTVQLSPDEQVQNVAVGDSGAWQVSVNGAGDHLFIKPLQADIATNMTVITSVRVYNFELFPLVAPTPDMAWNVRFQYPGAPVEAVDSEYVDVSAARRRMSRYRITGDRLLRPSSVTDDGTQTYISWAADRPIPAVFELDASGQERLVNGAMRGDEFVVDGVPGRLSFRMDRKQARAVRLVKKGKR